MRTRDIRAVVSSLLDDAEGMAARLRQVLAELDTEDAVEVARQGRWTRSMLGQLWRHVDHLPGVRALFEETAGRPTDVVSFDDIVQRSGLSDQQQRNEHARLSRVSSELFGEKRWPIQNWQGPVRPATGRAEMLYRMGPTVAMWWRELADD